MSELQDKVIVITGASSGIGEATAKKLAEHKAKLALVARRKDRLEKLASEIESLGSQALVVEGDVTDKETAGKVIEQVTDTWGQIDVLVNNAGVMLLGPVKDAPLEEWEQMIHTNVLGLLYMTHAAVPHMHKNSSGHIVNISSVAGRTTRSGSAVYNLTKWGVNAFTEALRQELTEAKTNIRTTLIEPGMVATELQSHNSPEMREQLEKRAQEMTPLEAIDIAAGIEYALCQPEHVSVNEILIRPTGQPG